jgi:hypothetical protein
MLQLLAEADRKELHRRLLMHGMGASSVRQIHQELKLGSRFGITQAQLAAYARRFEATMRPVSAALMVAALQEALPPDVLRRLQEAQQLLLWSRLVQQLADGAAPELKSAELVRLAALFKRETNPKSRRAAVKTPNDKTNPNAAPTAEVSNDQLATLVREIYGIDLATDIGSRNDQRKEAPRPID